MPQHSRVPLLLLAACAGPGTGTGFAPADPADPDRLVVCSGKITAIENRPDGSCVLHLAPRPRDARLLATGQTSLVCTVPANRREAFDAMLAGLEVGHRIEVAGYWVTNVATSHHEVRDVTSIDPFPDPDR